MRRMHICAAVLLLALTGLSGAHAQITVANGASYVPGQAVAPGSLASVFGQDLATSTQSGPWSPFGRLPRSLGGVAVTVNGVAAGLYFVSPGQIQFVVPEGLAPGTVRVEVSTARGPLAGAVTLAPAAPGVFTWDGMGVGDAALLLSGVSHRGPLALRAGGQPVAVTLLVTGLDLGVKPAVTVGGTPVEVTAYGAIPAWPGLQYIQVVIPPDFAGSGRLPVVVTSGGQVSNIIHVQITVPASAAVAPPPLPTPGTIGEISAAGGREGNSVAVNSANGTALVASQKDDLLRVIGLESKTVQGSISLPQDSAAHHVAVNAAGSLAAVTLPGRNAVALVDLSANKVAAVVPVGILPSHAAFAGNSVLVTNSGSSNVSVIDTGSKAVSATIPVGFGPAGLAVYGNTAVVANMQAGSLSLINISSRSVSTLELERGIRPREVAITGDGKKAVLTTPTWIGVVIVDLASKQTTKVGMDSWGAMGPGGVATDGNLAYVANLLNAGVTVIDVPNAKAVKMIPVDRTPRSLAVWQGRNQLVVLCRNGNVLDLVDMATYGVAPVYSGGGGPGGGGGGGSFWTAPVVTTLSPHTGSPGSTFSMTINGANLQKTTGIVFDFADGNTQGTDANIKVSELKASADGRQLTATVQVLAQAAPGWRMIHLETTDGNVYPNALMSAFRVQ
ncbi:MAG: hypothetical protein IT158_04365 [Bryobacterales bacterium]|nr:hypothetical protein [Bryobacterales bacterium]